MFSKGNKPTQRSEEEVDSLMALALTVWNDARELLECKSISRRVIKPIFSEYFAPLYKLLRYTVNVNNAYASSGERKRQRGRRLRAFTIVPLAYYQQKHIPLDTVGLHEIINCAGLNGDIWKGNRQVALNDAISIWNSVFDFQHLETCNRRFGFYICTNGIEIGVNMLKVKRKQTTNDHGFSSANKFQKLTINPSTRIIGLDPGRRSLYVAYGGNNYKQTVFECSNARWREISGAQHGQQKRRNWHRKDTHLVSMMNLGPSPKCCTTEEYNAYLHHFLDLRDDILGFYRDPKWRRLRFKTRITRQKAYETLARELTCGDKKCIIAYGSGGFSSTSKGHAPTPNKHLFLELKKRCKVRLVSEYRTSQVCSNCSAQLQQTKHWGLKKCNNHSAEGIPYTFRFLTLWNRDLNAARNIRFMFLYRNANRNEMPDDFRKKKEGETNSNEKGNISEACNSNQDTSQPQAADRVTA